MDARREGVDPRSINKKLGDTRLWPYAVIVVAIVFGLPIVSALFGNA